MTKLYTPVGHIFGKYAFYSFYAQLKPQVSHFPFARVDP